MSIKYIAVQPGMSEAQTMKTAVHETAHAVLHDRDQMEAEGIVKDQLTREVEAEVLPMWYATILDWIHRSIPFPILRAGLPVKI